MLTLSCQVIAYGQINNNDKIFSIGISEGIGGSHYFLSPAIDFSIFKSKLKFSSIPGYPRFLSFGLTQEINTFKNKNLSWIASINYSQSKDFYWVRIADMRRSFRNYSAISGARLTCLKRIQLDLQLGILIQDLTNYDWVGDPSRTVKSIPYGEFSLNIEILQIFKKI